MKWTQIKDEKKGGKLLVRCVCVCVLGGCQITQIIFHFLHNDSRLVSHAIT